LITKKSYQQKLSCAGRDISGRNNKGQQLIVFVIFSIRLSASFDAIKGLLIFHHYHPHMKYLFFLICFLTGNTAFSQLPDKTIRNLKSGKQPDDTSFVYWLPYAHGRSYLFVQGSNSKFSHKGELAYDFKMKEGSKVCAARGGTVVNLRSDSERGGLKPENMSDGNYIIIQHDDGSQAWYWHLKKDGVLVTQGQKVAQGAVIGLSGNTGYTAFPHLHFQVTDAQGKEILVRFAGKGRPFYIRPGNSYKAVHL
jgi:hypothetical protein